MFDQKSIFHQTLEVALQRPPRHIHKLSILRQRDIAFLRSEAERLQLPLIDLQFFQRLFE